jgi:hypothetical protein
MPGNNLIFYGTTGPSGGADGGSQPDRSLWLGRFRASQTLHEFQSTLTSAQGARDRHIIIDTARIGDGAQAHQLKWLVVQTGPAALSAARIESFDTATGGFKLDRRLAAAAGIGDDYAVFDRENVFPDLTALQGRNGDERFRCIFLRNEHGVAITNVTIHFGAVSLDGQQFARFHQGATPSLQPFLQRSDDVTDLFDVFGQRDPAGGPDNFLGSGGWVQTMSAAIADITVGSIANNAGIAIWLRRSILPAAFRLRRSIAIQVVATTTVAGSDPDPLVGSAIIPFDLLADAPVPDLEVDRFVHISGGARLKGTVLAGGAPLVGRAVRFAIAPGDLGTIVTSDDPDTDYDVTDEDGEAGATYFASTDPADEDVTSNLQLIVGDGDEVGDP